MDSDGERLEVGALSETGYTREENQDRMSGAQVPLGHLYIVADGMGGTKGGALAAQMAVEELQRHIGQASEGESADSVIEAAFKAANDAVYKRANSGDLAVEGMGTTAVLLLISGRIARNWRMSVTAERISTATTHSRNSRRITRSSSGWSRRTISSRRFVHTSSKRFARRAEFDSS